MFISRRRREMRAFVAIPAPTRDFSLTGPTLPADITFTRASVGTYFDAAGVMQTAAVNAPRFDYDPVTHAALGLLIEESRTNSLLGSDAPVTQNVTVTAVSWTLSFYGTGTVTLSGAFVGSLVGTGAFPTRTSITFTPIAGALTLTISGSVTQAQLELGASATSYIPTVAAAVTRAADVALVSGAAFSGFYNPVEGSLYAEAIVPTAKTNAAIARMDDGTAANVVLVRTNGTATQLAGTITAGSVAVLGASAGTLALNTVARGALAYKSATSILSGNGALSAPSATAFASVAATQLRIGTDGTAAGALNGWVRKVSYWNTRLTNAQLQALSSGQAPSAFSPASLFAAGEQGVWYDPSDMSTMFQDTAGTVPVTAVGQQVARINDKSGRGNFAIQATAASRPLLQQDGAGKWYLDFDGVDDGLLPAAFDFGVTAQMMVCAGVRKTSDAAAGMIVEQGTGLATAATKLTFYCSDAAGPNYRSNLNNTAAVTTNFRVASPYPGAVISVVTALYDYTQATVPLQNSIRVNGVVAGQTTNGVVLATSNFSGAFNLNVGRRSNGTVNLNARIYSLIMRGAASSAQQVADTEAYVAGKTGVVLSTTLESFSNSFDQEAFA